MRYNYQTTVIKNKVRKHFELEILGKLNDHITANKKLHLFASFKTTFKFETYLDFVTDFNVRSCLAKLRLGLHNLKIEAGSFNKNKTPTYERFCVYCKTPNVFEV